MDNSLKVKIAAGLLSVSAAGLLFIQQSEGTKLQSYDDGVGRQTLCVGHTKGVTRGMRASLQQCEAWLVEDTTDAGKAVSRLVKTPLTVEQYDSLISFTFNLGSGALQKSTLLKQINLGNCQQAGKEFLKWDKANVKGKLVPLKGLTIRRQKESEMWLSGCDK